MSPAGLCAEKPGTMGIPPCAGALVAVASHSVPAVGWLMGSALGCRALIVHCWPEPTSAWPPSSVWTVSSATAWGAHVHAAAPAAAKNAILIALVVVVKSFPFSSCREAVPSPGD